MIDQTKIAEIVAAKARINSGDARGDVAAVASQIAQERVACERFEKLSVDLLEAVRAYNRTADSLNVGKLGVEDDRNAGRVVLTSTDPASGHRHLRFALRLDRDTVLCSLSRQGGEQEDVEASDDRFNSLLFEFLTEA